MSLDAERALQGAILDYLRGQASLEPLLGTPPRVYDEPPTAPEHPYATLSRAQARVWGGLDGEGLEHTLTLTVVSRFGGTEEAKAVVAALRELLHEADLALQDHRLVNLRASFADVFRAADWRFAYGILRLRAVTEPL
jgi:hypothetical protein